MFDKRTVFALPLEAGDRVALTLRVPGSYWLMPPDPMCPAPPTCSGLGSSPSMEMVRPVGLGEVGMRVDEGAPGMIRCLVDQGLEPCDQESWIELLRDAE